MARTLIATLRVPQQPALVEVRALIGHPMETGYRRDADGRLLPRDILRRFSCALGAGGPVVFRAELHPSVAANPYFAFFVRAADGDTLLLNWEGDNGFAQSETVVVKRAEPAA
jgi:sulfur-oxidizing protein SoxZ